MSFRTCLRCLGRADELAPKRLGMCLPCATYVLAVTHDETVRAKLWPVSGGWGALPAHVCTKRCPGRDRYIGGARRA